MTTMAKRPKTYGDTTVPPMTVDFKTALRAMLKTPPPPAGDPSTRKRKSTKAKAEKGPRQKR